MINEKNLNYYISLHYPIEVLPFDSEDGLMYEACIPQLGRYAFTGIGETADQAIESLNKIKGELFSQMIEEGKDIPEPEDPEEDFSGKLLLRMDKSLHKELALVARNKNISLNKQINEILNNWEHLDSIENIVYKHVKKGVEKAIHEMTNPSQENVWYCNIEVEESQNTAHETKEVCDTDDYDYPLVA